MAFFGGLGTGAMLAGTGGCGRVSNDVGALWFLHLSRTQWISLAMHLWSSVYLSEMWTFCKRNTNFIICHFKNVIQTL